MSPDPATSMFELKDSILDKVCLHEDHLISAGNRTDWFYAI